MVKTVAVAEAFGQHLQNVVAVAEAAFDRNTAAYRRLITAMSESGGDLSSEQADELIRVCETLGIAPELMSDDASAIARAKQLNSQIEEVQKRNTARREPLPRMEAELAASTAVWLAVSEECGQRLREAEADVVAKRSTFQKLQGSRDESTEYLERDLQRIFDHKPHLLGPVNRDMLSRITDKSRRRATL